MRHDILDSNQSFLSPQPFYSLIVIHGIHFLNMINDYNKNNLFLFLNHCEEKKSVPPSTYLIYDTGVYMLMES